MLFRVLTLVFTLFAAALASQARAGDATIAVATNFLLPAREISAAYERDSGNRITLVAGSTGKLAAQILAGAPFDALLAADQGRVGLLVDRGAGDAASRFTYAVGRLMLWSPDPLPVTGTDITTLRTGEVLRLAIANPKLAPYGLAGEQTLAALGLLEQLKDRLVYGENIGQTFAMAASGNVTAALVAASQVAGLAQAQRGHSIAVPDDMHEPIRQDGALTMRGTANPVAQGFMAYLKGPTAGQIMAAYGYGKVSE